MTMAVVKVMQQTLLLICLLPVSGYSLDRPQLDRMLASAVQATGQSYLEARQAVLDLGTNALPLLAQAACDSNLTWQQRLVARICYERMTRSADIEALRRYDWRAHPQYYKWWEEDIVGVKRHLGTIAVPKFVEAGLWYYYLELVWKDTGEYAIKPRDPRINDPKVGVLASSWLGWCMDAVQGISNDLAKFRGYRELTRLGIRRQPESYYLTQVLVERLDSDPSLSRPLDIDYYKFLLLNKETNAVPVLVNSYDAYSKLDLTGPEAFPGRHEQLYRGMFEPIMSLADSRYADLIQKFIAEKPALAPFKEKLTAMRALPAPPPAVEPPFRMDHQPPIAP
jgi:hypothetical protein